MKLNMTCEADNYELRRRWIRRVDTAAGKGRDAEMLYAEMAWQRSCRNRDIDQQQMRVSMIVSE